ncbi:hypothetical protein M8J75_009568 [Diaphorina citri]|nr:hypothetical protein M8J75_009568 [Diaphorina citri]
MDPSPPPPPHHPYSHLWNAKHAADVRLLRDQEREKAEQERERLEKLRGAEQAVDKHFEESLRPQRLAQHKQRSGWNMAPSFPPQQQTQPQRVVEDPNRLRERYYPSHPTHHPHPRFPLKPEPTPPTPQQASPFKMYSYLPPGLNLPVTMMKSEPIPDMKNSVIVKNDKKSPGMAARDIYRGNSLLIEAPALQRPPYYTHPPAPKVVSPAPAHMYGKPTSKPPLSTSPYQQIPPHQPPPVSNKLPPPPPAHATSVSYLATPQTQPLDLGVCLVKTPPSPPKRKIDHHDLSISPAKKPCPLLVEPGPQQEPLALSLNPSPSNLSINSAPVSNLAINASPSNLSLNNASVPNLSLNNVSLTSVPSLNHSVASLASINTVPALSTPVPSINTPSTLSSLNLGGTLPNSLLVEMMVPSSTSVTLTSVSEPASLTTSPVPSSVMITNENSNSSTGSIPPSTKTESSTSSSSSGAHKLKKAWLQRHSGVEGTTPPPATPTPPPVTPPPATSTPPLTPNVAVTGSPTQPPTSQPPSTTPANTSAPNTSVTNVNGHGGSEDSSSSEEEEPAKRVPPKVKRKKKAGGGGGGGNTASGDSSSSRHANTTPVKKPSPPSSTTDSDNDSGAAGKKANGNNSPPKSQAGRSDRKRAKKKDSRASSPGEEGGAEKKPKDEGGSGQRDPFEKPPVSRLKKTGESWLQDGPCFEVAPKLSKCRECRWTQNQRSRNNANIFCRFYAFRRLRYTKNGQLATAGFSDPHKDAGPEDISLWLPDPDNPPLDIDIELGRFILLQLAGQFCDLLRQEDEALELNMSEDTTVAWKRVVQGVREMCDVCETTLFNFHWACSKCGFVVCIDCYRDRKTGCRDRDEASWLLCNNRQPHEQEKLMLTQIIAGNCLATMGNKMTEYRNANNLPLYFKPDKDKNKEKVKEEKPESPLDWLADVALNKQNNTASAGSGNSTANNSTTVSTGGESGDNKGDNNSGGGGGGFSKLRKLLIRRPNPNAEEKTDSGAESTSESATTTPVKTEPGTASCEDTSATAGESSSNPTPNPSSNQSTESSSTDSNNTVQLKHFQRLKNYAWSNSTQLDIRILTNTESKRLYPDVPHMWLCDGKLLRLTDPRNPGNYKIFQDMWRRGQPVLVSGVGAQLDPSLWHPDSFAADFGDLRNDLINCVTGNTVPNQSMRKFWEGFENVGKRLKDDKGQGMLLKLKDWPPGEDFAELLPTRFADLMRVLPLGEYTQRSGRLNLASRLPECFVKPDLGPKMYIAYGNALYPSKATTNLHLDISDAVNLMVHVGIPKDGDHSEYMREAYRAIDEGGSDILTRRRVRVKGELPGALWHIFAPRDADKIRDLLNKVAIEKGAILERNHDSIHDQSWYLDSELRDRLYHDYKVQAYTIVQCLGDAVRNLHSCIKVAEDFVSPENVSHCFHLTQEFRELSDTHSNHEDKLQVKNIIFHAVKDSLSVVEASERKTKSNGASSS